MSYIKPCIKFQNVSYFDILHEINFTLDKNAFGILIGHNGSGKSTILKLILGLIKPTKGTIQKPSNIAIVHQNIEDNLYLDLTILENFKLFGIHDKTKIQAHLKDFNPSFILDKNVRYLSGGEKQALSLAIRLFHKPDLLLLDEHTSALDPQTSKSIMSLTYTQTRDITCLMVTHNLEYAYQYGSIIFEMEKGKLSF